MIIIDNSQTYWIR